jgi:hypothetical protein
MSGGLFFGSVSFGHAKEMNAQAAAIKIKGDVTL